MEIRREFYLEKRIAHQKTQPKRLISEPDNLYYNLLEDTISKREKEEYKA